MPNASESYLKNGSQVRVYPPLELYFPHNFQLQGLKRDKRTDTLQESGVCVCRWLFQVVMVNLIVRLSYYF